MSISYGELAVIHAMETKELQIVWEARTHPDYTGEDLEDLLSAVGGELESRENN